MRLFERKETYWKHSAMVERLTGRSGIPTQRIQFGSQSIIALFPFRNGAIFALRIVTAH